MGMRRSMRRQPAGRRSGSRWLDSVAQDPDPHREHAARSTGRDHIEPVTEAEHDLATLVVGTDLTEVGGAERDLGGVRPEQRQPRGSQLQRLPSRRRHMRSVVLPRRRLELGRVDHTERVHQLLLSKSTDGGVTFSAPVRVGYFNELPDCATYQIAVPIR